MKQRCAAAAVRLLTGVVARWQGSEPAPHPRIYFANHTSNLDAPAIWAALPHGLRKVTRPVAARDYWDAGPCRRYLARSVMQALLIERQTPTARDNPVEQMAAAIREGSSLILFPEGGRCCAAEPAAFKSGLYHLARKLPDVELIPVLLDNLNRMLPRGEFLPVPLIASATFGPAIQLEPEECREAFLTRARAAVLQLREPAASAQQEIAQAAPADRRAPHV